MNELNYFPKRFIIYRKKFQHFFIKTSVKGNINSTEHKNVSQLFIKAEKRIYNF